MGSTWGLRAKGVGVLKEVAAMMLGRAFPFRQAQVETAIIYPEFRMAASWACDAGYRQIFSASLCVAWREGLGRCVSKQGVPSDSG